MRTFLRLWLKTRQSVRKRRVGRSKPRVRTRTRSRRSTWIACAIVVKKGARVHILYTICFVRGTWRVARGRRAQKCSKTCARNPRDRRTTKTSPRISIATVSASEQVKMNTLGSLWVLEMRAIRSNVDVCSRRTRVRTGWRLWRTTPGQRAARKQQSRYRERKRLA